MRRRNFTWTFLAPLAAPVSRSHAQQARRVAVLTPAESQWQPATFREAMAALGYREGVNLAVEVYSGGNQLDRLAPLAKEIVARAPDVIVAVNTPGTRAAMAATDTIPIISAMVADPVLVGIVNNITRPDANVTGISNMATDITSKRVALLKEASPAARRFALFGHPDEVIVKSQVAELERSGLALDIEHRTFLVRDRGDLEGAMRAALAWRADAVVRLAGQGFTLGPDIGRLSTDNLLPSMLMQKRDVEAGGLMSYFADSGILWRRVAAYVDRVLKGTKPSSLPFEMPSRFELIINQRTARMLKITLPPSLTARADELID